MDLRSGNLGVNWRSNCGCQLSKALSLTFYRTRVPGAYTRVPGYPGTRVGYSLLFFSSLSIATWQDSKLRKTFRFHHVAPAPRGYRSFPRPAPSAWRWTRRRWIRIGHYRASRLQSVPADLYVRPKSFALGCSSSTILCVFVLPAPPVFFLTKFSAPLLERTPLMRAQTPFTLWLLSHRCEHCQRCHRFLAPIS